MRRFLVTFTILALLAMAQNGVAETPVLALNPGLLGEAIEGVAALDGESLSSGERSDGSLPGPFHSFMLLAGLAGLLAAGSRPVPESAKREDRSFL